MKRFLPLLILLLPLQVLAQVQVTGGLVVQAQTLIVTFGPTFSSVHQNVPFSSSPGISGGQAPYTCAWGGSFPAGLTATGCNVSGTPTGTSSATATLLTTDSIGQTLTSAVTITPSSLSSIAVTVPLGGSLTVAAGATQQLVATGTWSDSSTSDLTALAAWSSGTPGHATVGAATGLVAGVATGTSIITATFNAVSGTATVTVPATAPAVSTTSLPHAQVTIPYPPFTLQGSGGTPPYTWAITVGALPTGLSLASSTGVISGTPTGTTQTLTFQLTDNASATATKSLTLTVETVVSNAVTCVPSTITTGSTSQCTSTTTFSGPSTADTTLGSAIVKVGTASGGTNDTTHTTVVTTSGLNVAVGDTLFVLGGHGTDTTSTITPTDTAGNIFTAISTLQSDSGIGAARDFYSPVTVANTNDLITLTFNNPVRFDTVNVLQLRGMNASPLDQHAEAVTTNPNACQTGTVTTTVASEVIIAGCRPGGAQTFTAQAGYALDTVDPTMQAATESQIVSSIQTAIAPTLSYNTSQAHNLSFLATLKAAGSSGAAWSCSANCSVNSSGVATGLAVGSATVTAVFGGQTGNTTITVNPPTITAITVSPMNPSGSNGSTVQFGAVDQANNNITNTVSWSSQTITCATINASGLATIVSSSTCSTIIQASVGAVNGTTTLTGTGTASSLLNGCTVGPTNVPSCATPAGWTLVRAQGFETGTLGTGEQFQDASFQTVAHTGTRSGGGVINKTTGGGPDWFLAGSQIGSRETYVSWWEFDAQPGRLNVDLEIIRISLSIGGNFIGEQFWDWQTGANDPAAGGAVCFYNCTIGQLTWFSQNTGSLPNFPKYGAQIGPPWGSWVQWEAHTKLNTPAANNLLTTVTDSSLQLYRNGTLVGTYTGLNLTGTQDFVNADLQVGGVYTAITEYDDSAKTICSTGYGSFFTYQFDFTIADACPNQAPSRTFAGVSNTAGFTPIFSKYFDDIILLKK